MTTKKSKNDDLKIYRLDGETHVEAVVKLTPEELVIKCEKLASLTSEATQLEMAMKASQEEWKIKVNALKNAVNEVMNDVRTKSEKRLVPVFKQVNFGSSTIEVVRLDDGTIHSSTSLSKAERDSYYNDFHQNKLPFDIPKEEQDIMHFDNEEESNVTPIWQDVAEASKRTRSKKS